VPRWYHPAIVSTGSRLKTLAGALPALLLAVLAIWELVATVRAGSDVPGDDDWAAAAAAVRAAHQPGDLIVFAPRWIDPVGRLHLGDLIPLAMAGRQDADRYGRIWELSIRGARADETSGLEPVSVEHHGGVTVRRFERTPAEVVTDLVAASTTRPHLVEVDFQPRRCVTASPGPGKIATLTWPSVELGSELVGHFALADIFTLRENLAPARAEITAGTATTTVFVEPTDGWVRFALPTTPGPAAVSVTLTDLTTPPPWRKSKPGERRHILCLAAEARR
jgi:hypothetical protein